MQNRRVIIHIMAATVAVALGGPTAKRVLAQASSIPLLHEGEPKALQQHYMAASKTADTCLKCFNYTELSSYTGTGMCQLVVNRRVMAGGVCKEFTVKGNKK
jgi:hypothetical protein